MGETSRQEEPQQNLYEHLAEGFRPIMACVGTYEEYDKESIFEDIKGLGENVNYHGHPDLLNKHGFKADSFAILYYFSGQW